LPHETVNDRPDLKVKVFRCLLHELLDDIVKKCVIFLNKNIFIFYTFYTLPIFFSFSVFFLQKIFILKYNFINSFFYNIQIFGVPVAHVSVIEYQKCSIPHAHILVWLHDEDVPTTPEEINKLISAEIPDRTTHPEAFELVTQFMIHCPCGTFNPYDIKRIIINNFYPL